MSKNKKIVISPKLQQQNNQKNITPELLKRLKYIATIQSIGSSMRLAGSKISDEEVEKILLKTKSFKDQR